MARVFRSLRLVVVTGLVAVTLSAFAGTASADPGLTPNGFCGAMNMVQAWGVGARGGMANAMAVNNANGNDGMWRAVAESSCR